MKKDKKNTTIEHAGRCQQKDLQKELNFQNVNVHMQFLQGNNSSAAFTSAAQDIIKKEKAKPIVSNTTQEKEERLQVNEKTEKKHKKFSTDILGMRRSQAQPIRLHRDPTGPTGPSFSQKRLAKVDADIFFQVSQNNTIGSLTTSARGCLYTTSSGAQGFRGARRGTSAAFFAVGVALGERSVALGLRRVHVHTKGMSKFRINLFQGLIWAGLTLVSLDDSTVRPHNGCRPPAIRRL